MRKVLLAGGAGLSGLWIVLMVLGTLLFLAPSSFAQTYTLQFIGLPSGSVDLTQYIGLDRKLKADVAGQILRITVTPPLTQPKSVVLTIVVSASGSSITPCNGVIATATTNAFQISGAGRELGSAAFTGASAIGVQSSTNQPCIDALADKMSNGGTSIPAGTYTLEASLYDASDRAKKLNAIDPSQPAVIQISGASTNEDVINLTSPQNGEQVTQAPSIVFTFNNSVPGRLYAFEHSSLTQPPEDATRDLSSPLKILDVPVAALGSNQIVAIYPGQALRPWMAGKKISWLFLGTSSGSGSPPRSPIWSFIVVSNDPLLAQLIAALRGAPNPVGSTYDNLVNSGFTLAFSSSNPIYLQEGEGGTPRTIDLAQALAFLADLTTKAGNPNVRIDARIASQ